MNPSYCRGKCGLQQAINYWAMSIIQKSRELTLFHSSKVFTTKTPANKSEWPPKYLVPSDREFFKWISQIFCTITWMQHTTKKTEWECRTVYAPTHQSAPNLNGYWRGGGPKVESTINLPPALCTWTIRRCVIPDHLHELNVNRLYLHNTGCSWSGMLVSRVQAERQSVPRFSCGV